MANDRLPSTTTRWFITYTLRATMIYSGSKQIHEPVVWNEIVDRHPVCWLADMQRKYGETAWQENGSPTVGPKASYCDYRLIFYAELPQEVTVKAEELPG